MVGSPTALGGHFPGMDKGPTSLRQMGLSPSRPGRASRA